LIEMVQDQNEFVELDENKYIPKGKSPSDMFDGHEDLAGKHWEMHDMHAKVNKFSAHKDAQKLHRKADDLHRAAADLYSKLDDMLSTIGTKTPQKITPQHRKDAKAASAAAAKASKVAFAASKKLGMNESVERATWVPDNIADEQVEAFMEAAVAAVQEGEDTFVFEAKHYKAKSKKEAKKLDPVGKADADIDNDGDVDSSDEYLKKRRAAIKKSMDEAEEMDPTKHVSKKGDMYCVYNKDGEEVAKFDNEEEANAYARKNHDALMGKEEMDEAAAPGSTAQHGATKETSDTFEKQIGGGRSPREKEFVDMHNMEVGMDIEKVTDQNKESMEKALKQTPARMGDQRTGDTSFVNPVKADIIDGITKALQQMKSNS